MTTPDTAAPVLTETNGTPKYDESSIQHLQNADHIRLRPANYIPDAGSRGLHHLVYELVYNSVDEYLAGACKHIHVTIHPDESLSVSDDGRGIPVDPHPTLKISTLELVLTKVGAGGKFDNEAYRVAAGLHGVGAKAVTALSELTRAEVRRNGRTYVQEYDRGKAISPVKDIGAADQTGTKIHFWPDKEIFGDAIFSYDILVDRMRELAFLNRGLTIAFRDDRAKKEVTFCFEGGVAEYVAWMNEREEVLHPPIHVIKEIGQVRVEAALQYTKGEDERIVCYANNQKNPEGGTHLSGFRTALTRTLKAYGEKNKFFKDGLKVDGVDFRDGIAAVINVSLPNPQFESNVKIRLNNPEIDGIVSSAVSEVLAQYLEENPKEAKFIMVKVALAAEAREAATKAKQAARNRKSILSGGGLPGKLMDCTSRDRDSSELFLVEGDSAGGSADGGRDRNYQAVLPLRGKVLNVEKARLEKLLENKEITSLIAAIGIDIGNPEDISELRYGKIVILTDADVDGQHIRTLLLTFFFRQMRKLIEAGNIYVARPPLFKVTQKKNVRFIQTSGEMSTELMQRGLNGTVLHVLNGPAPKTFEGDALLVLLDTLDKLEAQLQILERRGVVFANFIAMATDKGLPIWHVKYAGRENWFHTAEEVDAYRQQQATLLGHDLVIANADTDTDAKNKAEAEQRFNAEEFHEIRTINKHLQKLTEMGFVPSDLVAAPRIAGREPIQRFSLEHGEARNGLSHLRELTPEVRHLGEKGLTITRFKGLGEMNADELWETTLNPEQRILLQVTLVDAQRAHELFRTLMGEEVEKRRNFIFEKGINVKDNIDYGA